jgi:hypothetical protein
LARVEEFPDCGIGKAGHVATENGSLLLGGQGGDGVPQVLIARCGFTTESWRLGQPVDW